MSSSQFVAWAKAAEIDRGPQEIGNDTLGLVTSGIDSFALSKAGENPCVSLGDGGSAILQFEYTIRNGEGPDFAVFENSFDTYRANLGEGFGILAPHCKLWFHNLEDVTYLKNLKPLELEILLAQIDWEICGIYAQKFHLPEKQSLEHLRMLIKVQALALNLESEQKLISELTLLFERDFLT